MVTATRLLVSILLVAIAASITPAAADYRTCMEFCSKEHTFSRCNEICAGQSGIAPETGADCSTDELKGDALYDFLYKHYGEVSTMALPSDQGADLIEIYFHIYQPQEKGCEGVVRIEDDCRITDAEGVSLNRAASREQTFQCVLSSG